MGMLSSRAVAGTSILQIGRLVRFANIEQCERLTGGQALFEHSAGQFGNLWRRAQQRKTSGQNSRMTDGR